MEPPDGAESAGTDGSSAGAGEVGSSPSDLGEHVSEMVGLGGDWKGGGKGRKRRRVW